MSRRADGKRSFSSSDLGYEKATINSLLIFLAFSFTRLYHDCLALAAHLLFLFIFLSILLDTLIIGLSRSVS